MLVVLLLSLPAGAAEARVRNAGPKSGQHSKPHPAPANPLASLLDAVLSGKRSLDGVRMDVFWAGVKESRAMVLYGNGVGIWRGEEQIHLSQDQVKGLLKRFRDSGYVSMPARFGAVPTPENPDPIPLCGSVSLGINGTIKTVNQAWEGKQSVPLTQLATTTLDMGEAASAAGVSIDSLADGLSKIADGTLAPETFSLQVNRVVQTTDLDPTGESWIIRVNGLTAESESFSAGGGFHPRSHVKLTLDQLTGLVKALLDGGVSTLPDRLFADHFTDLSVKVLDKKKNLVAASNLPGITPSSLGDQQEAFDKILTSLDALRGAAGNGRR